MFSIQGWPHICLWFLFFHFLRLIWPFYIFIFRFTIRRVLIPTWAITWWTRLWTLCCRLSLFIIDYRSNLWLITLFDLLRLKVRFEIVVIFTGCTLVFFVTCFSISLVKYELHFLLVSFSDWAYYQIRATRTWIRYIYLLLHLLCLLLHLSFIMCLTNIPPTWLLEFNAINLLLLFWNDFCCLRVLDIEIMVGVILILHHMC